MENQNNLEDIKIKPSTKTTTDIWFVVFLRITKDKHITRWDKTRKHRVVFHFEMSEEEWMESKLEFDKSTFSTIKYEIEAVKDLVN